MPYPVFASIWKRNIEDSSSRGHTLTFESGPPEEGEFHLSPDGDFVVLEMKDRSDVLERQSKRANVMELKVSLSFEVCRRLLRFLQTEALVKIEVSR